MGSLIFADCVQDTTTTTGTGTLTLANAPPSARQSFNAGIGDGNDCLYKLEASNNIDWETGRGTYTNSSKTLTRTTIYASSNAGSAINLPAGTHKVYCGNISNRVQHPGSLFDLSPRVPKLASWTQVAQSTTTFSENALNATLSRAVTVIDTGKNAIDLAGLYIAAPGTPYRVAMKLLWNYGYQQGNAAGCVFWGFSDGTKFDVAGISISDNSFYHQTWTNSTTRSAATKLTNCFMSEFWGGVRDDGTNYYLEVSGDGANYTVINTGTKSGGFLGSGGYTNIFFGYMVDCSNVMHVTCLCYDTNGLNRVAGF